MVLGVSREYRHIVRIAETDIAGEIPLSWGLSRIKGVGYNMAVAICRILGLDPSMPIGFITDQEIEKIEELLKNPQKYSIPAWFLNRRKDYETGNDMHLVSSELIYYVRQDIDREIRIRSWRGIRHAMGYKVRGQRTHTTGRIGPVVGVQKKKAQQQK